MITVTSYEDLNGFEYNVEDIKISNDFDATRLCSCSSSGSKKITRESSNTSLK